MTTLSRRSFLGLLGLGAAGVAADQLLEPAKKLWFVPSNAPVGSRIERVDDLVDRVFQNAALEGNTVFVRQFANDPRWNGGYRVSDFEPYLDHADRAELAYAEAGGLERMTPGQVKNMREFCELSARMGRNWRYQDMYPGIVEVPG